MSNNSTESQDSSANTNNNSEENPNTLTQNNPTDTIVDNNSSIAPQVLQQSTQPQTTPSLNLNSNQNAETDSTLVYIHNLLLKNRIVVIAIAFIALCAILAYYQWPNIARKFEKTNQLTVLTGKGGNCDFYATSNPLNTNTASVNNSSAQKIIINYKGNLGHIKDTSFIDPESQDWLDQEDVNYYDCGIASSIGGLGGKDGESSNGHRVSILWINLSNTAVYSVPGGSSFTSGPEDVVLNALPKGTTAKYLYIPSNSLGKVYMYQLQKDQTYVVFTLFNIDGETPLMTPDEFKDMVSSIKFIDK